MLQGKREENFVNRDFARRFAVSWIAADSSKSTKRFGRSNRRALVAQPKTVNRLRP